MVPWSKIYMVYYMHLAHTQLLRGHLGEYNMLEKLIYHFHWPRMVAEKKPALAPLIPLPINNILFQRVSTDLVRLCPKFTCGHEYMRVLTDYITRYPETIPLHKATYKNIAWKLVLLFS